MNPKEPVQNQVKYRVKWEIIISLLLFIALIFFSINSHTNFSKVNERIDTLSNQEPIEENTILKEILDELKKEENPTKIIKEIIKENKSVEDIAKIIILNKNNIPLNLGNTTFPLEEITIEKIKNIEIGERRFTYKIKADVLVDYSGDTTNYDVIIEIYKDNYALETIRWDD